MTWKQQLTDSITTPEQLAGHFGIDPEPLRAVASTVTRCSSPPITFELDGPDDTDLATVCP